MKKYFLINNYFSNSLEIKSFVRLIDNNIDYYFEQYTPTPSTKQNSQYN